MTLRKRPSVLDTLAMGIIVLFTLAVGLTVSSSKASAANPIEVVLDEQTLTFDENPSTLNGTTLVQFRPLFEAMGLTIKWDSKERTVTGTKNGISLSLKIGSKQASVNGTTVELPQAAQILNGQTMVPVRFISESTGALVAWNPYKPQIIVYTEQFLQDHGITKEQAKDIIDKELARIKAEYEAYLEANPPLKAIPVPAAPKGSGEYKSAASGPVDLSKLQGMYYGFSDDHGGYECGGICWNLYTFLPGNKVLVGAPPNGGPETIDCKKDTCHTYTIMDGKLTLNTGDTYSIAVKNGQLVIEDVPLEPVKPVTEKLTLTDKYIYRGYYGLVGISGGSTSWSRIIEFNADTTFKSNSMMLGSVQGGGTTHGSSAKNTNGSYRVTGNTLVLAHHDGTIENLLFFLHDEPKRGPLGSIQLGENNFYVD